MASWRVARSLDHLLAQLNDAAPDRSRASDGSIGDAAHASRNSDHNPWVVYGGLGVVTARDFTHDPADGLDCEDLYQALVSSRDPRIKYIIWNRTITSGATGSAPWTRRSYAGSNPHDKHLHLSVQPVRSLFDDTSSWQIRTGPQPHPIVTATQLHCRIHPRDGLWGPQTDRGVYVVRQAAYGNSFPHGVAEARERIGLAPEGVWDEEASSRLNQVVTALQNAWGAERDGIWGRETERTWKRWRDYFFTG